MTMIPSGLSLPRNLDDIDASFMTTLLQNRGLISSTNEVVSMDESGVGMTAGFFSSIKRIKCHYKEPTNAQDSYIVKAWPDFELAPGEDIANMFAKDIKGYQVDPSSFYPRPTVLLADYNQEADLWALVMEDACTFGEQKLHENELNEEEVMRMIPGLVDIAVAWEASHKGEKAKQLDELDAFYWASEDNLSRHRLGLPAGAKFVDYFTSSPESTIIGQNTWHNVLGPNFVALFTNRIEAFYDTIRPENGGTCTIAHGDIRGDNLFFCEPGENYPHGWLTIDFQLTFRGPIPSDLAYLLNSGTVLPEVYSGAARDRILRAFYDDFMAKTEAYPDYSWDQFRQEYAVMSTVLFVYMVNFGAAIYHAGIQNEQPMRLEFGDKGETEADLAPDELRKRMWWRKAYANFLVTFKEFGLYEQLQTLPDNKGEMGPWIDLPERLQRP
jgi:hypothetical protein